MSVEDRLRTGLAADANALDPRAEEVLGRVLERGAQRRRRQLSIPIAAAAAVAASVALIGALVGDQARDSSRGLVTDDPADQGVGVLAATYIVVVPASEESELLGLAGRWVITIDSSGNLSFAPPPGQSVVVSGSSVRVDGDLLETNALLDLPGCQTGAETGVYRWRLEGPDLDLEPVGGDCRARSLLFGEPIWRQTS